MALALILTARKLRPYFLSHPIAVLTNSLLGRVMTHPDTSGRLVKWAVELGEYDIEYQPRVAIKAQALSDFLTEILTFGQEEVWRVFMDGASSSEGSGVGVVLISPTQEKTRIAMRLHTFKSNNEAEYEAVATGLKLAREAGAEHVIIYSDSQLVVQQLQECSVLRKKGCESTWNWSRSREVISPVGTWSLQNIEHIPREHNTEADALAKMATSWSSGNSREVIQQVGSVLAIEEEEQEGKGKSWMTPLINYLQTGTLPSDGAVAQKVRRQIPHFTLLNGSLYRRSFQGPLLRCLEEKEVKYVLQEIHEGCCGDHGGMWSLARRTQLAGYWWPTLQQDARQVVNVCEGCQRFGNFSHKPASELQAVWASCPFDQWGLDIVGPFPLGSK
ncbi:uncharacterized protein [Henckelia pumila]|uniref:uncharacterized protein n=1 Tax=Henckelia pumila TaxID=405737 RepID=UPI003C6E5015